MRSHVLVQELRIFGNLCCVCTGKGGRGWASGGLFVDKGVNFSRFCADFFYGWPLILSA